MVDALIDRDLYAQLEGHVLTTAEITYWMPDFRDILQLYVWQDYDVFPRLPVLRKFLDFWSHNLDGPLAQVRVACASPSGLVTSVHIHHIEHELALAPKKTLIH